MQFSDEVDNWASRIWVDTRYLSNRNSLIFTNGKTTQRTRLNWSTQREMLLHISQHLFLLVGLLRDIREGRLPQEQLGTVPQSMSQYRRLVGGYRVPKPGIDTLVFSPNSRHIVVMYAGRIYTMPVYSCAEGDRPLTAEELYQLLCQVLECSEPREDHAPVGLLTSLERDSWNSARDELIRHSPVSASSVREIESSLFGLCIDECTYGEGTKRARFGDIRDNCKHYNRWNGLGLQTIFTKDGLSTIFTEHSMIDGILTTFYGTIPKLDNLSVDSGAPLDSSLKVRLLNWDISLKTYLQIEAMKDKLFAWYTDYDLFDKDFTGFGKNLIKNYGVYYHGFIHLAIQLAYYKLYNQLTASYQTVSLKSYREGRLEHPITVSEEIKRFVESMTEKSLSNRGRLQLLLSAVQTYKQLLADTSGGHVFVKHMLALKWIADKECMSVELFQNSHFKLFMAPKLAISSIYSPLQILATYPLFGGHFIGIHPMSDSLYLFITTIYSNSTVTSLQLYEEIEYCLYAIRDLIITEGAVV